MAKYIPLDALVAEIERLKDKEIGIGLNAYDMGEENGKAEMCNKFLSLLDTLEVKEVDLDKELVNYNRECVDENGFFNTEHLAKHFYSLGMAASNKGQKGE